MEALREPLYQIIWTGKDVSRDVVPYLISLNYTDYLHGKSDEIELIFEDRNDKWKSAWYPQKGDQLEVKIGIKEDEEKWLKAGIFEIDEVESSGPPDIMRVKGLSAFIKKGLRQLKTRAWESIKLSGIVLQIASEHGLDAQVKVGPEIEFKRLDQKEKSDLNFVRELADKYGYYTKIDHGKFIFVRKEELEKYQIVATIERGKSGLKSYSFFDKTHKIYKGCMVKYWDPVKKQELSYIEEEPIDVVTGDYLKISERVENLQQAIERARAELRRANRLQTIAELTLTGDPFLVAGAKVKLFGFGMFSAEYLIEEARHNLNKNEGYITTIKMRRC